MLWPRISPRPAESLKHNRMSIDRDRERYLDRLTLMGSQMEVRAFVGVSSFAVLAWDDD